MNKSVPKINSRGYALWRYGRLECIDSLNKKVKEMNLPVLERKWPHLKDIKNS